MYWAESNPTITKNAIRDYLITGKNIRWLSKSGIWVARTDTDNCDLFYNELGNAGENSRKILFRAFKFIGTA